jgi:polyphosphate kinase
VSRERGGTRQLFSYLSTGNFNEKTARVYCDHGLLTADPRITEDVEEVFRFLWQETESPSCKHLLVAPFHLRDGFGSLMAREVDAAAAGEPCGVVLKINSLEDERMMEDILRLGSARVPTNLIVRGICRLPLGPGGRLGSLKGRSIVDRFLEHARIFRFVRGGDPVLLLSSADLMRRNLERRVEVAFPIFDAGIREELDQLLHFQLSDNTKARVLDASLENTYVGRRVGEPRVQAQPDFYRWLEDRLEP